MSSNATSLAPTALGPLPHLLAIKLTPPTARALWVARPCLIESLAAGLQGTHRVTLIAAPAGFGMTTLLSAGRASSAGGGVALTQGNAAAIRANIALYTGDVAGCVACGEQVLRWLPETELIARTTARLHVTRAFRVTGHASIAIERQAAAAGR